MVPHEATAPPEGLAARAVRVAERRPRVLVSEAMSPFTPAPRPMETPAFLEHHPTSERAVEALIVAAKDHPLGTEFLVDGHLEAVAVTFQVHAFTVDAARRALRGE